MAGGDPIGIATNVKLVDNRFCEEATQLVTEPGASSTEQGTLTCPFPDPVLEITQAVLLSWPCIEEGCTVESFITMDGAREPLNATPFLQDGRHSVAIPMSDPRRFFRLRKPGP